MIMEIQAGDILRGRYEIQRLLRVAPDKGIYLAHDRVLDRPVVVDVFQQLDHAERTDRECVGSASAGAAG
jgi:hypothetical protein